MFLFLKLYLAHLIADYILQPDELYQLKVKSGLGHIVHVLVHLLISLAVVAPYLGHWTIWIFVLGLTGIHFIQDHIKYKIQKDPKKMFTAFVIDQIFHALFISTILFLPVSHLVLGFPRHPVLNAYYTDNFVTLLLILFILSTFGGSYLLYALRKSYFPNSRIDHFITTPEMIHGILERTFISAVFLLSPHPAGWILAPAVGILRLFSKKLRNTADFLLSFSYAALLGLIFRMWI